MWVILVDDAIAYSDAYNALLKQQLLSTSIAQQYLDFLLSIKNDRNEKGHSLNLKRD